MATGAGAWRNRWRKVMAGAALAGMVAAHSEAAQTSAARPGTRVRGGDPQAAALLDRGVSASPTFRQLVDTIERSDVIVHVETRPMTIPGRLQFAGSAGGSRYLRVSVRVPGREAELVAWLGHELQHAVELAGAPEVVDHESLLKYYRRVGMRRSAGTVETLAAQQAWRKILDEVKFGR